jgi:hypothetical protein
MQNENTRWPSYRDRYSGAHFDSRSAKKLVEVGQLNDQSEKPPGRQLLVQLECAQSYQLSDSTRRQR